MEPDEPDTASRLPTNDKRKELRRRQDAFNKRFQETLVNF